MNRNKRLSKFMGLMLSIIMLVSIVPIQAVAAEVTPDTIPIYTAQDLSDIRNNLGGSYVLMNNIELSGNWEPIPFFSGSLDGKGHTISNLTITRSIASIYELKYIGLFAGILHPGIVKNLGLIDVNIDVTVTVNGYGADVGGISGLCTSIIKNCYVTGDINVNATSGSTYINAGAIAGYFSSTRDNVRGVITNCYSVADISVSGTASLNSMSRAGGIVGYDGNLSDLTDCVALGDSVLASGSGIAGIGTYGHVGAGRIAGAYVDLPTNNYANSAMTVQGENNPGTTINGIDVVSTTYHSQAWWSSVMWTNVWGGETPTDDKPWIWDDVSDLPVLYTVGNESSDATLSILAVSAGTLTPAFNSDTTSYTVTVPHSDESITISATTNDSKAAVSGTGTKALVVGENSFNIVVTAENETQKTYSVQVVRGEAPVLSGDATLSVLTVSAGTLSPAFNANTTSYTVTVPYDIENIVISATANDAKATVSGSGLKTLAVGSSSFYVVVTAEIGIRKTYTIIVTRNADATAGTNAEFLQERAAEIKENGLSQDQLRLNGKILTLVIDGKEFVLSTKANNRNASGEIALGDGYYLKFDIKGNGSNIKEFSVIKK